MTSLSRKSLVALVLLGAAISAALSVAWKASDTRAAAVLLVGGARSCIQVAAGSRGYRPAGALSDLTVPAMFSRSRFHGILVVGPPGAVRLHNWSHRTARWQALPSQVRSQVAVHCVPRLGYLDGLTWLSSGDDVGQPSEIYVALDGPAYLIPETFRPEIMDAGYISIDARPPSFEPSSHPSARMVDRRASLEFRSRDWLQSLAATMPPERAVTDLSNATAKPPIAYVERDQAGQVTTVISCPVAESETNPAPCQHRFYRDGAMWSFRQSIADLPRWREFQTSLTGTMSRFADAAARCEADAKAC